MLKIDAINYMLTAVGEAPVNSIATADLTQDAAIAVGILDMNSRNLQSQKWGFNTAENETFTRDVDGVIARPSTLLYFSIDKTEHNKNVSLRGDTFYWNDSEDADKTVFDEDISGIAVYLLDWDDIPEQAQQYIVARSTRIFAERTLGTSELTRSLFEEEQSAYDVFYSFEVEMADGNYLDDPLSAYTNHRYI